MLIGLYMHQLRPGRVLEGSLIGLALLLLATVGGGWIDTLPGVQSCSCNMILSRIKDIKGLRL